MKTAVISSVFARIVICVPLGSAAQEQIPEGAQLVQVQPEAQSQKTSKPDEETRIKLGQNEVFPEGTAQIFR